VATDLAARFDLPRQPPASARVLTVEEVDGLLATRNRRFAGRHPGSSSARAVYASGLRISEAVGLDRDDLLLEDGWFASWGRAIRERQVPVGEVALGWLRRYISEAGRPG